MFLLDAARFLLMTDVTAGMNWRECSAFWEALLDTIPDLTAHLPALTKAVSSRDRGTSKPLEVLSDFPFPTALPPERADWRAALVAAWEKQLQVARRDLSERDGCRYWENKYSYSLKGLVQVDQCPVPPGMTCSSVLPTLLGEVRYVWEQIKASGMWPAPPGLCWQLECLSTLAGWRPAANVTTALTVLKQWGDFWLELYQLELYQNKQVKGPREEEDAIVMKGVAAKALLNLMETGSEKETGVPAGMEIFLLESLISAARIPGVTNYHSIHWLDWRPQDATRFPADQLAALPENLLKKLELASGQEIDKGEWGKADIIVDAILKELVRWDRAGLLDICHIDILPSVVTNLSEYMHYHSSKNFLITGLLGHKMRRWIINSGLYSVKGGDKLFQQLEYHLRRDCGSAGDTARRIAWEMRIQLQQAGLAAEDPAAFEKALLEAIKKEKSAEVRLVLSIWRPRKETPNKARRQWERLWQKGLKSRNEKISHSSAVALLRPDPDDDTVDPAVRWQKLRETLCRLPEQLRPKLSIGEITHLMEQLPTGTPNTSPNTGPNQMWQFRSDEIRFRVSTEPATPPSTPVSTPTNVQSVRQDNDSTKNAGRELQPGRYR